MKPNHEGKAGKEVAEEVLADCPHLVKLGAQAQERFAEGESVIVREGIGKLRTGRDATIVRGPIKVAGVSGVYIVRDDRGVEEEAHGSRLRSATTAPE
jgi:hypothetical protein